jgi:hypothetical protein
LAGAVLAAASLALAAAALRECGCAQGVILRALEGLGAAEAPRAARNARPSAAVAPGLHA